MLHRTRPSDEVVRRLLDAQCRRDLSYPEVGATSEGALPPGYDHRDAVVPLGAGDATFAAARAAIDAWAMFDLGWVELRGADGPPVVGGCVAPVAHALGVWSLNAARVVSVVDEPDRYGFAYGTLPAHAERGEERFLVTREPDGTVTYGIRVFSRPKLWYARVAGRYVRGLQARFRADSGAAMQRAVSP